jgi:hypothetical protein
MMKWGAVGVSEATRAGTGQLQTGFAISFHCEFFRGFGGHFARNRRFTGRNRVRR